MDRDHQVLGDDALPETVDDVVRSVEGQPPGRPFFLVLGDLVPYAHLITVPAATGVGEVEDLREVRIQIRLVLDAEGLIVVFLPDILAVIRRPRAAVHADAFHWDKLPQRLQILAKIGIGGVHIPVTGGQGLVMVADLVAQGRNFPDDPFVPTLRDSPEIVDAGHPLFRLQARRPEGIPGQQVHVVAKHEGLEAVGLQGIQQDGVFIQRKIHRQNCSRQAP